jgi:hypothetical protein
MTAAPISSSTLSSFTASGLPRLLFITHAWGGGVEQHVQSLVTSLAHTARVAVLRPCDAASVMLSLPETEPSRLACTNWSALSACLRALGFARMHLHHTHGFAREILDLDLALGIPLDCSLHDFGSICPQYQLNNPHGIYCGEPDADGCNRCISLRPHAWSLDQSIRTESQRFRTSESVPS